MTRNLTRCRGKRVYTMLLIYLLVLMASGYQQRGVGRAFSGMARLGLKTTRRRTTGTVLYAGPPKPAWLTRADEEVIIRETVGYEPPPDTGLGLFDSLYRLSPEDAEDDANARTDISSLTLRDVSEAYQFSLSYLGDFVVQAGKHVCTDSFTL
jgi:hypothetical protein